MPSDSYEGMSDSSRPADTSSGGEWADPQTPVFSLNPSRAKPTVEPADTGQSQLACPVSGCSFVSRGEMPHRQFWRHLKQPELYGLNGDEEVAWLNHHETEYKRLLAVLEDNRVEEERKSRNAKFESRARKMGITEEGSVAEKVAIWEGMWAAEQAGDDIQYGAGILLDAATGAEHQ
ncbi:hypothetical protein HOY82DRAFT_600276 [Tuber indicum]|nr:hypothetical protein HOY82DRAFT_600276 [Tuber indicum]